MIRILCLTLAFLPGFALAQDTASDRARDAIALLDSAVEQLDEAQSARDRVRALTATIAALEDGLGSLRSGLRQASAREAELSQGLAERDEEIAALLAVLMRLGDNPSPVALLHPGGPTGTVRAGLLLSEMAPALNAQAASLRADMTDLDALRRLQDTAESRLADGLLAVQQARTALNQAIAERTDLPKRFANDPVREAILIASAETLSDFASGLDRIAVDQVALAPDTLEGEKGALPLPVRGTLLRDAGEPDAAGVTRPGILLETAPKAIVTTPVPATLRYTGPLLDFGQVVILEPQASVLFVLAGLETVYGAAGDVIDAGTPLGLMGSPGLKNVSELSTDGDEAGTARVETLYIEVRQDNTPEDPKLWFRMDKDG